MTLNVEKKIEQNQRAVYVFRDEQSSTIGSFVVSEGKIKTIRIEQTNLGILRDICNPMFLEMINGLTEQESKDVFDFVNEIRKYKK